MSYDSHNLGLPRLFRIRVFTLAIRAVFENFRREAWRLWQWVKPTVSPAVPIPKLRVWFLGTQIFGISTNCTWSWKKLQNLPSIIFTFPLSVKYSSSRAKWRKYTRVCDEIAIDITVRHCLFGVILSLSLGTLKNPFWPVVSQIEHFTQFLGFGDMTDVGSHCSKPKMLWIFYDFLFFRTYGFSREREFCLDIWRIERVTQATLIFFLDLQIFSYSAFIW